MATPDQMRYRSPPPRVSPAGQSPMHMRPSQAPSPAAVARTHSPARPGSSPQHHSVSPLPVSASLGSPGASGWICSDCDPEHPGARALACCATSFAVAEVLRGPSAGHPGAILWADVCPAACELRRSHAEPVLDPTEARKCCLRTPVVVSEPAAVGRRTLQAADALRFRRRCRSASAKALDVPRCKRGTLVALSAAAGRAPNASGRPRGGKPSL